jgi:hypothetical protein
MALYKRTKKVLRSSPLCGLLMRGYYVLNGLS